MINFRIVISKFPYKIFSHCTEKPIKTRNDAIPRIIWRTIIVGPFLYFHNTVF